MFLLSLFLFSVSVSPFSCYYCSQSSLPVVVVVDRLFPSPSPHLSPFSTRLLLVFSSSFPLPLPVFVVVVVVVVVVFLSVFVVIFGCSFFVFSFFSVTPSPPSCLPCLPFSPASSPLVWDGWSSSCPSRHGRIFTFSAGMSGSRRI